MWPDPPLKAECHKWVAILIIGMESLTLEVLLLNFSGVGKRSIHLSISILF